MNLSSKLYKGIFVFSVIAISFFSGLSIGFYGSGNYHPSNTSDSQHAFFPGYDHLQMAFDSHYNISYYFKNVVYNISINHDPYFKFNNFVFDIQINFHNTSSIYSFFIDLTNISAQYGLTNYGSFSGGIQGKFYPTVLVRLSYYTFTMFSQAGIEIFWMKS